jgi:hypothetical protein
LARSHRERHFSPARASGTPKRSSSAEALHDALKTRRSLPGENRLSCTKSVSDMRRSANGENGQNPGFRAQNGRLAATSANGGGAQLSYVDNTVSTAGTPVRVKPVAALISQQDLLC